MSAPLDCSPCRCTELESEVFRLRAENQRLQARLASIARNHREPFVSIALRAESLDDAAPRPHRFLDRESPPIVIGPTPTTAQREELRRALDAYDRASSAGVPLYAHGQSLRAAAANAGIPADARSPDWTRLISASRELVSRAG